MAKDFDPLKCSLLQASRCLGVDRNTLAKWMEAGAPFIEQAQGNKPWVLSVPEIFEWKMELEKSKAVEAALRKISPDGTVEGAIEGFEEGQISIDEAKRRKAVADALIREIDLDTAASRVVPIEDIASAVSKQFALVRKKLFQIPNKAAKTLVGEGDPAVIRSRVRKALDDAMQALQEDKLSTSGGADDD